MKAGEGADWNEIRKLIRADHINHNALLSAIDALDPTGMGAEAGASLPAHTVVCLYSVHVLDSTDRTGLTVLHSHSRSFCTLIDMSQMPMDMFFFLEALRQ